MPATMKVVSVFAVALVATASGYFLLVPDDHPDDSSDIPIERHDEVQSPAAEISQNQRPADRADHGERDRRESESSGLMAESVLQTTRNVSPNDSIVNDADSEHEPLWKRMVQSDSGPFTSAKGEVDMPPQPDDFVGPPLIENDPRALGEGADVVMPLAQPAKTESSEVVVVAQTDAATEAVEKLPQPDTDPHVFHVKQGDTYQSISKEWFGDETKWGLIAEANPQVDPRRMQVGQRIMLPEKKRTDRGTSVGKSNTYVVRSGDTLSRIATLLWGDPSKWRELYTVNRKMIGESPDNLKVGMKLILPAAGRP